MRSTDEVKIMTIEKFRHNIGPEGKRSPAVILAPSLHVLVGIRPQQVAQETWNDKTLFNNHIFWTFFAFILSWKI